MEFIPFPKMARLSREIIITEKLDGTNAQIYIEDIPEADYQVTGEGVYADNGFGPDGYVRVMKAGSRTRWLTRHSDNFGFANWAFDNANSLMNLGPGRHFGEWWGKGIQRGYGLNEKRFSLFNTQRWQPVNPSKPVCCDVVPVLYQGDFDTSAIEDLMVKMYLEGSTAAPGFMNPEGIVIFHTAGNVGFKKTLDKDHLPKALANV